MLRGIFDVISSIGDFFTSIGQFIVDFIQDLVYVVHLLGDVLLRLPSFFEWLPSYALAILTPLFSIIVIYKILGRS